MKRYSLEERARILRALGTESRMLIIETLKQGPLDVGDLAEQLGISQSAVSQHLKVLKELGLVQDQRHSYFIAYSLNPQSFAKLEQMMLRVCQISYEHALKQKQYERQLRKERLLKLRAQLQAQLKQIDTALNLIFEQERSKP